MQHQPASTMLEKCASWGWCQLSGVIPGQWASGLEAGIIGAHKVEAPARASGLTGSQSRPFSKTFTLCFQGGLADSCLSPNRRKWN